MPKLFLALTMGLLWLLPSSDAHAQSLSGKTVHIEYLQTTGRTTSIPIAFAGSKIFIATSGGSKNAGKGVVVPATGGCGNEDWFLGRTKMGVNTYCIQDMSGASFTYTSGFKGNTETVVRVQFDGGRCQATFLKTHEYNRGEPRCRITGGRNFAL